MNANLMKKTIEMTKNEAKAAGKIGSEEFKELRQYMEMYPTFTIDIKAPAKRKVEFRGLNYEYMKNYIKKNDDEDGTIMAEFRVLRGLDEKGNKSEVADAVSYGELKMWFLSVYPEAERLEVNEILAKAKKIREAQKTARSAA